MNGTECGPGSTIDTEAGVALGVSINSPKIPEEESLGDRRN